MDNNIDTKKIIQMVIIIGALCLFVGIVTRIRQNSQTTLEDYGASTSKETDYAESDVNSSDNNSTGDSVGNSSGSSDSNSSGSSDSNSSGSSYSTDEKYDNIGSGNENTSSSDEGTSSEVSSTTVSDISLEEYDAFFYTDNSDGTAIVKLLYYNMKHEVASGELICNGDNAYQLMLIFYKLYKNHYEFTSIIPLEEFESEEASRIANNTYCVGDTVYINPLYNPLITYENNTAICTPSEAVIYIDRTTDFPYKINTDDYAYTLFTENEFYWGGNRNGSKDYAAFSK